MITCVKMSKLDKVPEGIFRTVSVTTQPIEGIFNMADLLPEASDLIAMKDETIGKKKFRKRYTKRISVKNSMAENSIFAIGNAIQGKDNVCFVCTDQEFQMGYLKELCEYIAEIFGVEYCEFKDVRETVEEEVNTVCESKKEKKLIWADDEELQELSDKKLKVRKSLIKSVRKALRSYMSEEGMARLDDMKNRFAIEQITLILINSGVAEMGKDGKFKNIDADKIEKIKPFVQAILIAAESSKGVRKVIKKVFESHDIKLKEKQIKDLGKENVVALIGELYTSLQKFRSEVEAKDSDDED